MQYLICVTEGPQGKNDHEVPLKMTYRILFIIKASFFNVYHNNKHYIPLRFSQVENIRGYA